MLDSAAGSDVAGACRKVGVRNATYYKWLERYYGMARSQLQAMYALEKKNA